MYKLQDCQEQANMFYCVLTGIVDKHAPIQHCVFKNNDKPWINQSFKALVDERNNAFNIGDVVNYNRLRNKVNRLRKQLQKTFLTNVFDR